jgi:AcrR family transcriptional regulator
MPSWCVGISGWRTAQKPGRAAREMADSAGGLAPGKSGPDMLRQLNYTVELQCREIGPSPQGEGATAMTPPPADRRDGDPSTNADGRITRDLVLATALELIDRDGVDGLSMRRLARVLGRDPMILYRHAPNKAALLDGVAETVLAQLKVDPADPDWAAQLRTVARGYRALALAHPNVVPLLVTRPLATPLGLRPPGTLRPLEAILTLLTRAGFSGPDALHIYRALFGFLHGHVLNELQELIENPDETDDLLRLGLHRLPIREFPLLRSLAPALASYDGASELERGLDILLTGLTDSLTPRAAAQAEPSPPADDLQRGR